MAGLITLESLKDLAINGDSRALDHLSQMASVGGSDKAKEIIREIDEKKIVFKDEEKTPKIPKRFDLWKLVPGPVMDLVETMTLQLLVRTDGVNPPSGYTQEEFLKLNVFEATKLLKTGKIPDKIWRKEDFGQIIFHPIESIRTKTRQELVGNDQAFAPVGSNQEDFPNLRIAEATALLRKKKEVGGVPFESWTKRDQKRMEAGLKPQSHPEHPNV
jgi:hypothetical protein